jgi:hypothetical protein
VTSPLLSAFWRVIFGARRRPAQPVAKIDAAELIHQEVSDQLSRLPIGQDAELHVVWIAERLGAQMNCATFAANVADLWFPATDDIACVLYSAGQLLVLVLDHEELITLSRLGASQAVRHPGEVLWMAGSSCCWPWFATGDPARCPQLDLLISARFRPREGGTVLDELIELERRGFVRRAPGGTGYRWAVTDAGSKGPGRRVRSAGPLLWEVNRRCPLMLRNRLAFAAGMVFGSQNFVLISEAPCGAVDREWRGLHFMRWGFLGLERAAGICTA